MRCRSACVILGVVLSLGGFSAHARAAALERSISTSRQFIVYGPEAPLRGAICDLAERTKKSALTLLRHSDGWNTPIVIHAQPAQANLPDALPARLNFSQTGSGLKIQLDLKIGADVSAPAVEREILRAVLLERMYRDEPETPAGTPYVEPPHWLVDGILTLARASDSASMSDSLAAANGALPLDAVLQQQPALLDSPSRTLYHAYSAAVLSMLIEAPGGAARLQRFIVGLSSSPNDPVANLRAHFPELGTTAEDVEKNWTRAVARFAGRERYRMLGCEETERQLAQVLRVEIQKSGEPAAVYRLDEFATFLPLAGAAGGLARLTDSLLLLSGRANPLYRPVIAEYQQIAVLLARKKTKKIAERLAGLQQTREAIGQRMTAIEDYMNWFEATQARARSGAFGEYMKAAELSRQRKPRRRDPISVYLDALEAQLPN